MFRFTDELSRKIGDARALFVGQRVSELWLSWASGIERTKAPATIRSLNGSWKHLEPLIGSLRIEEINGELWTNLIIPEVRKKTHSGYKFFNMRKWLGMFIKWAFENNKTPFLWRKPKLLNPDPRIEKGRIYTPEETTTLEAFADWLLLPKLVMACPHFMRRSEIALLRWDRIDRESRVIYLRAEDTKIRKARRIPYSERLESLFKSLEAGHAELGISSAYVFPSPINPDQSIGRDGFMTSWTTCKRKAGIKGKAKFHWLRKTALTRAANSPGANHMLICEVGGLRIDELQRTYYIPNLDDIRRVLA